MNIQQPAKILVALLLLTLGLAACGNIGPGTAATPIPTADPGADTPPTETDPTPEESPPVNGESDAMFDLAGTSWIVENVTTANESMIPAVSITLDLHPDGTFGGNDGCNLYSGGKYQQDGDTLTIELEFASITERFCDEATMESAERFFSVLDGTHQISLSDGTLLLTHEDGSLIRLARAESTTPDDGGANDEASGTMPVAQPLDGTRWLLVGYGPDGATEPLGELTLTFEGAQMSGFAGCNQFSAPYELDGEQLKFPGQIVSTLMACQDDALNEQERTILDALGSATTATREANTLTIGYDGGELQYVAMETDATALEDQMWTLSTMLIGGDAAVSPSLEAPVTMTFQDGRVSGSTGCNQYFTDYTVEGNALNLGVVGSTRRACADGLASQEQQFLELFRAVNEVRIEGQQLTLLIDGAPALILNAPEAMP